MDSCSHNAVGAPIVLNDEDGSDTELEATLSAADAPDEDDDGTLGATPTPPPDANGHDNPTSVPAEPIANDQAQDSAPENVSGSGQSLSDRSVKPNGSDRMDQPRPSSYRQHDRPPFSTTRGTNPVRHGPLTLENPSQPSQQSVHGRECAMTPGSARIGSDGSSAGCLTNMERDDGGSSSQMEDQQHRESAECNTPTRGVTRRWHRSSKERDWNA